VIRRRTLAISLVLVATASMGPLVDHFAFGPTASHPPPSAGSKTIANSCVTDLNRPYVVVAMPNYLRLKTRFSLGGATFTSVPRTFIPVAPPTEAWRDYHARMQSTATYRIFLTRMTQDVTPGANPAFESQIVWLVLAQHVAFIPSPPPVSGTSYPRPSCAFGFSYWAVNATSGKSIYGAAG